MKKRITFVVIIILAFGGLILWHNNKQANKNKIAIYIVRINSNGKDEIVDKSPVVTEKDIKKYYWDSHRIEFTEDFLAKHNDFDNYLGTEITGGSGILGASDNDSAIITVNGKEIYRAGFLFKINKGYINTNPLIIKDVKGSKSIEIIRNAIIKMDRDPRNNRKIYTVLKELGLLAE